jgi:putative spermidine/putrescine transport system permease protein
MLTWSSSDQFTGTPLQLGSMWLQDTRLPLILALEYVILVLPFAYRTLDAGLRTSSITTLIEAARSLGAPWVMVLMRVIIPTLRTAILNTAMLAFALVLGEYTMAKILLFPTYTVWLKQFGVTDGQLQVSLAFLSLFMTWAILLAITIAVARPGIGRNFLSRKAKA